MLLQYYDNIFKNKTLKYSRRYGVTKAAIFYKTNRQYIYRWIRRWDGSLKSLREKSRRPHHHPNQQKRKNIISYSGIAVILKSKNKNRARKPSFLTESSLFFGLRNKFLTQNYKFYSDKSAHFATRVISDITIPFSKSQAVPL